LHSNYPFMTVTKSSSSYRFFKHNCFNLPLDRAKLPAF
jgi:hypothetical protein